MAIHPTAVVDRSAEIDAEAEVGAYAVIEGNVRIGAGTRIWPHAYVGWGTTIGKRCQIYPFAVVGHHPQDLKWAGTESYTVIGDDTVVREHATIHRGTAPGSTTIVGARCYIMSIGHVGHNCVLEDEVKVANSGLLSGHVYVGRGAFVSGNVSVHQFVRIGELAIIGGGLRVPADVPPFMMLAPAGVIGPNVIGMRRAGLSAAERQEIRECHRVLYRSGLRFPQALERVAALVQTDPGRRLVEFLRAPSKRGYCRLRRRGYVGTEVDEEAI
jgi:UDP-N-acetylglucosamine acyltransferase